MKLVIQRVTRGSVVADGELSGQIGPGLVLLLGIEQGDTLEQVTQLATKVLKIRLWPDIKDPKKQWSSSVVDNNFELLVVSQFTLFASFKKPKPDFHQAMGGEEARTLYEEFLKQCRAGLGDPKRVATGVFGAMMQVDLTNDGPVTVELVAEPPTSAGTATASPAKSPSASPSASGSATPKAASKASGKKPAATSEPAQDPGSGHGQPKSSEEMLRWEATLAKRPYLGGFSPTSVDRNAYQLCSQSGLPAGMPNLRRWYEHVASFSRSSQLSWP